MTTRTIFCQGKVNFNSKSAASWEQVNKEKILALIWKKRRRNVPSPWLQSKAEYSDMNKHMCLKACGEENNCLSIILRFPHVPKQPHDLWHLPHFSWVWDWEYQQCCLSMDPKPHGRRMRMWAFGSKKHSTGRHQAGLYDLEKELGEVGSSNL